MMGLQSKLPKYLDALFENSSLDTKSEPNKIWTKVVIRFNHLLTDLGY